MASPRTVEQSDDSRLPSTTKGRGTRQRLLSAATDLFDQHGYAGVRVSDITEAAGLSPGAFYRYFTDRRELMLVLLEELTAEAFDFVRFPWDENDPMESVFRSTQLYFEFYEAHRPLFAILVELGQTDPDVANIWASSRKAFYSRIAQSLRRGTDAGKLRVDLDINVAAELMGGMTEFYAFQRFVLDDGVTTAVPIDESTRNLVAIWTSGLVRHT
ncbi:TetR/AcrR family transcriptional regulator [Rhodococcus ruber]|uniref:TetR/AcrR family transcriptional regulator n=1 Tax=Rhodococcus TaxID=1827 RepID=UPI00029A6048|nr:MULTISPECIES: TetR/AcrR family transcriptional regulator [Rhodococcus]ATQ30209.1 TetR/AcrR family transcriptional regulator [Rhodococcus ruber]